MKNNTIKKSLAAVILCVALLVSFTSALIPYMTKTANTDVSAQLDKGKQVINDYETNLPSYEYAVTDPIYKKANIISQSMIKDVTETGVTVDIKKTQEKLKTLADSLNFEEIIITSTDGKTVAAYPDTVKDINIKKDKELNTFYRINKFITVKASTTPTLVDGSDNTYSLYAGIQRPDYAGSIIVKTTTDNYDKVLGTDIANDIGANTIVAKDGKIVSTTIDTDKTTLKDLGIDSSKTSFESTISKTTYSFSTKTYNDYTIICGVQTPQPDYTPLVATGIADAVVLLLGLIILFSIKNKETE